MSQAIRQCRRPVFIIGIMVVALYMSALFRRVPFMVPGLGDLALQPAESVQPSVMVLMAMVPYACLRLEGEIQKAESLRNRLDFARLHGYRFHVEATVNPDVDGHWNKVALLHRALRLYPDVEWFFMSDIDSIVLHPHVPLPLNRYPPQADLVISGDPQKVYGKDPDTQHCLNSGVLLLRNTPWMRSFLDRQLAIARVFCGPTRDTDEVALKIKAFFGERYNKWIQDQTALVYLLNQLPTQDRAKVYWESQAFNSPDMWIGKGSRSSIYNRNESIFTAVHFSGCQFCYSKSNYLNDTDCFESWNAAWQKHLWLVRREDYLRLTRLGSVTWLDAQPGNLTT